MGNILDVLLVYVTMTCNKYPELHKKHSNVDGDIIMHKLSKDGARKKVKTDNSRKSLYFWNDLLV